MSDKPVRVRFAPSPTGPLHMGGVRTALFNYLFAKQNNGTFILRIEDTDTNRFVPGAEEYIIESLKWCGIKIDEGVSVGGPHGPYKQSERKEIYLKYVDQLLKEGKAYIAFDSNEELEVVREKMKSEGKTFIYNFSTRNSLVNSLTLPKEEVDKRIANGDQYVVRFLGHADEVIECNDIIRGLVKINSSILDDKVLWKSVDQLPTYHMASIVDDHTMEISHVIRGEEWLPSMPFHVLLYKAFNWEAPEFAHLSLILKPSEFGKGKLSKRDGALGGFPVFPLEWEDHATGEIYSGYREDGYMPEAFINTIALLGWNPGTNQEVFTMEELIKTFNLKRVIKSGAKFSPAKSKWFSKEWIKNSDAIEVINRCNSKSMTLMKEYYTGVLQDNDMGRMAHTVTAAKGKANTLVDLYKIMMESAASVDFVDSAISQMTPEQKEATELVLEDLNSVNFETSAKDLTQIVYDICIERDLDFKVFTKALRKMITNVDEGLAIGSILYINRHVIKDRELRYKLALRK